MIERILNGALAVVGASLASQFPEFYQQYLQRLEGRLEQATLHETRLAAAAEQSGLTLPQYLAHFAASADPIFRAEGRIAAAALADAERLRESAARLVDAGAIERPLAFVMHFDAALASATAQRFAPAVPLTPEGLAYAGFGLVLAIAALWIVERSLRGGLRGIQRMRRAKA